MKTVPVKSVNMPSGRYASPDGKYVVNYHVGDASQRDRFMIASLSKDKKRVISRRSLVKDLDSMHGFAWLPKHPHTLVFAARRDSGKPPFLALWNGGKHFRTLIAGNLLPDVDPDAESFYLTSVSAQGRFIVYRHMDATTPEKEKIVSRTSKISRRFYLPVSKTAK